MTSTSNSRSTVSSIAWSVCVSFAFWVCLLVSAGCFAAVALAPKCVQWQRLNEQFAANQHRLVTVENQTLQLREVVAALNEDPLFAEELARVEFDAFQPGEEMIPVDRRLRLDPQASLASLARPKLETPVWQPLVIVLAGDRNVRTALLLAAAVLVIVSFTWLQDASESLHPAVEASGQPSWWQRLRSRYRRQ
jgi:cell division protein FtsB